MRDRRTLASLAALALLTTALAVLVWIARGDVAPRAEPGARSTSPGDAAAEGRPPDGVMNSWRVGEGAARSERSPDRRPALANLEPPAARGRVMVVGAPLPYAVVEVWRGHGTRAGERLLELRADAEGQFAVSGLPVGQYELAIKGPGVPMGFLVRHRVIGSEQVAEWGDLVCPRPASLAGRVVAENGRAVAGVRVFRVHRPFTSLPHFARTVLDSGAPDADPSVVTDEYGRYRFDGLLPGDHRVLAESRAFRDVDASASLEPGQHQQLGDLVLRQGQTVQGRVLDSTGVGVRGAEVMPVRTQGGTQARRGVRTNADGTFVVRGLEPFGVRLEVLADGFAPALVAVPGRGFVTVELEPALTMRGRVLGLEGQSATLHIEPESIRGIGNLSYLRLFMDREIGADGVFEISGLGAGDYKVQAEVPGVGSTAATRFTLAADSPWLELSLVAMPVLQVEVVDSRGAPVANARVYLDDGPTELAERYQDAAYCTERIRDVRRWQHRMAGVTDAEGRVRVLVEADKDYFVAAVSERYLPSGALVRDATAPGARITMMPAGRIVGRLSDAASTGWFAMSVASWPVVPGGAIPDRPETHGVDRAGQFSIGELRSGRYALAVSRFGMTWNDESRRSMPSIRPLLGSGLDRRGVVEVEVVAGVATKVELAVPAVVELSGRVMRAGRPVSGAMVFGWSAKEVDNGAGHFKVDRDRDHEGAFQLSPHMRTDVAGRYCFAVAQPGRWRLFVRDPDALVAMPAVEVEISKPLRAVNRNLELGAAVIRGRFDRSSWSARERKESELLLFRGERSALDPFYSSDWAPSLAIGLRTAKLDSDGGFELVGLPAGDWVLRLTNGLSSVRWHRAVHTERDRVTELGAIVLAVEHEVVVPVELPPVAEGANGSWESRWGGWVRRKPERGKPFWVRTAMLGENLELPGMVPGRYEVQRFATVDHSAYSGGHTGKPVGKPVVFELHVDGKVTPAVLDFR